MPEGTIHNDEATAKDTLNRLQYATAFARVAETCDTPLVIGMYGGWGVGKTSLMKLIEKQLDRDKAHPVWFDPWQHQFDETPALALLHTVVDTFEMKEEGKKLLTVIAGAFGSLLLKATTTLSLQDVDDLGKRYEEERFQVREARVQLQEHFKKLIEHAQGKPKRRLVFFIDDLDRCMPANTLSLVESLKLYLNLPECVYFLGVDREALEHSIRFHYKEVELSQTSYLDKIVQLPFTIPPIAPESMKDFVKPLLSEGLKDCQELLVKSLGDNPRQVKRFINILTLNHRLASELNITGYDPKLLAVLLLIQLLDAELYRVIARQPEILRKLKAKSEDTKSLQERHIAGNERLREVLTSSDIPQDADLKSYIYFTQVAPVTEEISAKETFDLLAMLSSHEQWVNSGGMQGKRADLSGATLRGAYLSGADLRKATLRGANLRGADLSRADLRLATLREADLSRTDLSGADLSGANLRGADLRGANLSGANLSGANLNGANLRGVGNLTEDQLADALSDETTTLPDGSKGPFKRGSGAHVAG